jgi:membrane protein YqaA with SNARE-associated domain
MKTLSWDGASKFLSRVYLSSTFTSNRYVQVAFLLLGVGMVIGAYFLKDVAIGLSTFGYPGVFFLSLLGSASMILPVPGLISLCTVSAILNPFTLGLLAAIGETIGEVTGYAVGFGGKGFLDKSRVYQRVKYWMEKRGALVIFIVSIIPNPLFDIVGIAAGATKYPVKKFFLIVFVGKILKGLIVAYSCYYGIQALPWVD